MQFLLLLENITFLVMIGNMVSMIKVWLILSLNLILWFYLIVDYWFNFLSKCISLFYNTVKFLIFSVWTSLFDFLLLFIAFVFSNLRLLMMFDFFFLYLLFITLYCFFSLPRLSILSIGNFFIFHFSFNVLGLRMSVSLAWLHFMRKILFIKFK